MDSAPTEILIPSKRGNSSNTEKIILIILITEDLFQSPRSGAIPPTIMNGSLLFFPQKFQSPRSGAIPPTQKKKLYFGHFAQNGFNPLEAGQFLQQENTGEKGAAT